MIFKKDKGKIDYDFLSDSLFIFIEEGQKYLESVSFENLIIDYDKEGNFKAIEILNASDFFKLPKSYLKNIVEGNFKFIVSDKLINFDFIMKFGIRNKLSQNVLSISKVNDVDVFPFEVDLAYC